MADLRTRVKGALGSLGLLTASFAICFVVLEIVFRLLGFSTVGERQGHVIHHKVDEFEHMVLLNSLDLREAEIDAKQANEFRVLAVGDSFTYGLGVEEEETFVRQTERLLRERAQVEGVATHFRVINGGGQPSPYAQAHWLREVGLGLAPDLVHQSFFIGNDLYDDLQARRREQAQDVSRGAKLNRGGDWGFKTVFRKSVFLDWVWSRLVLIPGVDDVLFDAGLRYGPLGMFLKEQPELEKASWEATLIKMEEIRQILTGAEVEQIVMIIPTAQQVRYRDKRPANQDYRLPNRILAESLTEHGVDFFDMLNLIEVQPAEVGDAMYYVRDIHWTPEGHRFAAEILAERIWDAATKESGGVEGAVKPSVEPPPPTR